MLTSTPTPNPRELLPPLLACLPTAAFSSRPPPALSDLLTPILRQKLQFFASTPSADSWLKLLNWNRDEAAKLPSIVEQMNLEAHPVSGEVEIEDVAGIGYRRLDLETLYVRMEVEEFDLLPVYMWCPANVNNGNAAWLLAELKALEDLDNSVEWFSSIEHAETAFKSQQNASSQNSSVTNGKGNASANDLANDDDDDDDSYWAAYDRTPGGTPSKRSPAPGSRPNGQAVQGQPRSELDYYERYAAEVQPALDPYDAEEDMDGTEDSGLNHHRREFVQPEAPHRSASHPNGSSESRPDASKDPVELVISVPDSSHHPQPSSASSPRSIRSLEAKAESQSQAEIAIKQHISTDFKSLYRLARTSGISREEFERVVKRELEVLSLMEME